MTNIIAEINIQVKDEDRFTKYIANQYNCEESEVDREMIREFLNDHIEMCSTLNDLFVVIGGDTDGWLLNSIN